MNIFIVISFASIFSALYSLFLKAKGLREVADTLPTATIALVTAISLAYSTYLEEYHRYYDPIRNRADSARRLNAHAKNNDAISIYNNYDHWVSNTYYGTFPYDFEKNWPSCVAKLFFDGSNVKSKNLHNDFDVIDIHIGNIAKTINIYSCENKKCGQEKTIQLIKSRTASAINRFKELSPLFTFQNWITFQIGCNSCEGLQECFNVQFR